MKRYDNEVYNYVDQLKNYSTTNISSIQKGIVPEVVDLTWKKTNYYVADGIRKYVTYETKGFILRVTGVRYRVLKVNRKNINFDKRMTDAVNEGLVYPFMLFVNGHHIKWSSFRVVRNSKYTYIVADEMKTEDVNGLHIEKVAIVNLPYTYMSYSESRRIPGGYQELFRFADDGTLSGFGATVYSLDTEKMGVTYGNIKTLNGGKLVNYDLGVNSKFKLTNNNFLCWKNSLFDKDLDPEVKNLNLISMNNGDPIDYDLDIKYFYRDITNHNLSNITIPENTTLLKHLVAEKENEMPQLDTTALGRDFDFKYKGDTEYEDNVNSGIRYISRYNSKLFNDLYKKRLKIHSRQFTGAEFKQNISNNVLRMPRGFHKSPDVYVMIHKDGELWDHYHRIRYVGADFEVPLTDTEIYKIADYNTFEIVYFTGVNNNFIEVNCTEDNNSIENTLIKYDDLMVFANYTEDHIYKELNFNKRTIFDVKYKVDKDHKRITFTNPAYYGKTIYMAAKNQFKYAHFQVNKPTVRYFFSRDFIPCLNTERFVVFHNNRMLTKDMYRVIVPQVENTSTEVCIHVRRVAQPGDTVDVFYLPYDFNYVDIGRSNQVDVVTVRATIDKQPMFSIPYPSRSQLLNGESFFLMRGSVMVDQSRYNVIGRKIVFNDPDDYVDYGRELTFVFIYNKNIDLNPYGGIEEEDVLNVDPRFITTERDNQLEFEIPYPKGFNGFFFVSYRGLYVNPNRYIINEKTKTIRFLNVNTGLAKGTAVVFVFIYPNDKNKVSTTAVTVRATISNQTKFSIPLPYTKYFEDDNSFFLIKNGVFLNSNEYYIDKKEKTVELLTTEGLDRGQELVFNFITGKNVSVKTAIEEVRADQDGQMVFKLPKLFHDYNRKESKFFCVIGDTYIDNRRFEIDGNDFRFLNNEDRVPEGRILTFIFAYLEEIDSETATIGKIADTSKYATFKTQSVVCSENGQRVFNIPWTDSMLLDKKILVTVGSTFIRESQYTISKTNNTLTIIDDNIVTTTDRQVTFTLIDSDYVVIQKEIIDVDAIVDNQMEFDIPLPYRNYFKQGNSVMVFANQTYLDPTRYNIDVDNNKLYLLNYDETLLKGQQLSFLYFYIANQSNKSLDREDVQHPLINERGYIYLNRVDLEHPMNSNLYFLYINGKKIDRDNIKDIANNIIRLKSDVQTRFNTVLIDYTPSIPELDTYRNINSDYDIIMNQVSNEDINKLFNIYNNITDLEGHIVPDTSQEAIINDIIRTHYLGNGINKGLPFVYTYDTTTLKNRSIYELATTTHRYISPAKYTFVVPKGVSLLNVKTIASAGRIKPITKAMQTLGYFTDSDIEYGGISYVLPTQVADYVEKVIGYTNLTKASIPLDKPYSTNLDLDKNNFQPSFIPKRLNDNEVTRGRFRPNYYHKEVITNVKVYPGLKYRIKVPENGFVNIAYNLCKTDLPQYNLPYRINFDSDRHSAVVLYKGDTTRVADEYIEDFAEIYSDNTMLEYNQPFKEPGEFYWTCPDHVAEIILTMCSGYKSTPTDANPNHIDRYSASFQFCGYNYIDFSTAQIPEPGNIEDLDVNKFYDRIANEYDSTLLNTVIGGSELLFATDHTEFAIGTTEVGFVEPTDTYVIDSSGNNTTYRQRFNYLLANGVSASRSISTIPEEVTTYIKVKPLESYTIYVTPQTTSTQLDMTRYENKKLHGAAGISFTTAVEDVNTFNKNMYIANTLNADHLANPHINYEKLNVEPKNSELVGDPSLSHVISEEEAILEKDKPVFNKPLPEIDFDDENEIIDIDKVIIHDGDTIINKNG